MFSPLEQFEVIVIFPMQFFDFLDISFTNITLYLLLANGLFVFMFYNVFYSPKLIPSNVQLVCEGIFELVNSIVLQQVGKIGLRYFPIIFYLFLLIYGINLIGLVPYAFTPTSHVICTFTLGFSMCLGILIIGFLAKGLNFLKLFVPSNIPSVILPFIVVIEVISYMIRPISLSMRLFANIMAGHTLLNILGAFTVTLMKFNVYFFIFSFLLMLAIMLLEFGIAFLQAYVFVVLVSVYLNDSL